MADWNSTQYLKFKKQRTQPAVDLAMRVLDRNPKAIVDIGCGPGNSTSVLKQLFPNAKILGIDNSSNMIEKASPFVSVMRWLWKANTICSFQTPAFSGFQTTTH